MPEQVVSHLEDQELQQQRSELSRLLMQPSPPAQLLKWLQGLPQAVGAGLKAEAARG